MAHELARQWFGDSVGVRVRSDIRLDEGFACSAERPWREASGVRTAADSAASHYASLIEQPQDLVLADPGAASIFDDRVSKRGTADFLALLSEAGADAAAFEERWLRSAALPPLPTR